MAGAGRNLPAWYKEMEKDLECPVCLNNILDPPIYVCVNQHGLCSTCHKKLADQVSFYYKSFDAKRLHCSLRVSAGSGSVAH